MLHDFPPEGHTPLEKWQRSGMHRLTHRYGHRAVFIWLVSLAWMGQAIVIILSGAHPVDHLFHTHIPVLFRVALWVVPAAVSTVLARSDAQWIAFVALALAPTQRLMSYAIGAGIEFHLEIDHTTAWEYVGRSLIWAFVILVLWLISTWTDPPRITVDQDDDRRDWT